jgi:hypothetical protein
MKKFLIVVATGAMLTAAAMANQFTFTDYDFNGVDCFPQSTAGWNFELVAGDGLEIVSFDDLGWGYAVLYTGGGELTVTLSDCEVAMLGAMFIVGLPNVDFNFYFNSAEVDVIYFPMTFCDFCDDPTEIVPTEFALADAYPNPFNPVTTIDYSISEPCHATLTVFNVAGQEVVTLVDGEMEVGNFNVTFDAADMASGVYFYKLNAGDFSAIKKMTLVK